MPHTLAEKILLAHTDADDLAAGRRRHRPLRRRDGERRLGPGRVPRDGEDGRRARLRSVAGRDGRRPLHAGEGREVGRAAGAPEAVVGGAGRHVLRPGPRRHRAHAALRGGLDRAGLGDRGRRLPHLHLRRARRVRDGARLHRHRVVPRARLVLAGGARDDPDRAHRPPGQLRHGQGRDPRRDRADRRRRRDERGARVRRPGRGGALGRRAARGREHGGRGGLGDGHLPGRRGGGDLPRGPRAHGVDGGALRSRRDVPAAPRDRPVGARAARGAPAPAGQRDDGRPRPPASRSTRSTSATARTGR